MALDPKSLTDAIDTAFGIEWKKVKTNPLPDAGKDDRRLMFAAVARGVLQYLSDHQGEFISSVTLAPSGTTTTTGYDASATQLNITMGD